MIIRKIFFSILFFIFLVLITLFLGKGLNDGQKEVFQNNLGNQNIPTSYPTQSMNKINQKMSFAAQAPFGDWNDPRQQDGCEEASAFLAVSWARHQTFTKTEALSQILNISKFEEEKYGSSQDTSAKDTAERILKNYFNFENFKVKEDIDLLDIISEIEAGNILITPMNGQALMNPNYTFPGPDRHMLVVKGYDPIKKQILTNDVGTRQGENYAYEETLFFNAIRDYPTGNHQPIIGNKKTMIVIYPR